MLVRQLEWRATSYGSRDRAPPLKRGVAREVGCKSSFIQAHDRTHGSRFVICGPTLWADKEAPVKTRIGALVLLILPVVFTGCGGGGTTSLIGVSISPLTANLSQGGTQSFSAAVSGTSNSGVNWAVQEGGAGGSITSMGAYTAPNKGGTFHVIATSQADTSKSATATVNVAAAAIFLNEIAITIDVGNQFMFVANVTGTGNTAVSWAIQEGTSGGSITSSGVYTAPGTHGTSHVIA